MGRSLQRSRVEEREGGLCFYCGTTPQFPTVDHVIPLTMGGGHISNNVVFCCKGCNDAKADHLPDDWYTVLKPILTKKEMLLAVELVEEKRPGYTWRVR